MVLVGADAGVETIVSFQLPDQKDQTANTTREDTFIFPDFDDALVALAKQDAGIHEVGGQRIEQLVCGNHGADVPSGNLGDRAMDNAQLRAKLALRAGGIHLPEAVLPETAANRKQRVVLDDGCTVLGALGKAGALEVA